MITSGARPIEERCGCNISDVDYPHVKTTKWMWRDMVFRDRVNAGLLGTCNGRHPRTHVMQDLAVELSMIWDRMDLIRETYPLMPQWAEAELTSFTTTHEIRYSKVLPHTPFRYKEFVERLNAEEDPFMDDDQSDILVDAPREPEADDSVQIASPVVRHLKGRQPGKIEIPKRGQSPPSAPAGTRHMSDVTSVPETPQSQIRRRATSPTAELRREAQQLFLGEKRKRVSEVEALRDRAGFKTDLKPASQRRTGTKEIPIRIYDEEAARTSWGTVEGYSSEEDSEMSYDGFGDWCMDLDEALEHRKYLRNIMNHEMGLVEKCRRQREYSSISRHIRKLRWQKDEQEYSR